MMRVVLSIICVLGLSIQVAWAQGDADAGKAKAAICAACHGVDGNSTNPVWPKIAGQHEGYLFEQIMAIKTGDIRPNPLMQPMVGGFSEQDIRDLAAFFSSQPVAGGFANQDKPEQVALGQSVYRAGNPDTGVPACMACHGPTGTGNALAGFPSLSGQHAAYTAIQLRAFKTGSRKTTDRNVMMIDLAKRMSEEEIDAVAEYITGLH